MCALNSVGTRWTITEQRNKNSQKWKSRGILKWPNFWLNVFPSLYRQWVNLFTNANWVTNSTELKNNKEINSFAFGNNDVILISQYLNYSINLSTKFLSFTHWYLNKISIPSSEVANQLPSKVSHFVTKAFIDKRSNNHETCISSWRQVC